MKKVILTLLIFIIVLYTANAQKDINFHRNYAAGGKMIMNIDSSAKNIVYALGFPNQPHTYFNYLPEVNNVSIQINFRKNITIQDYRYTILVDNKPILLNKSIDMLQLKDTHAGGDEEVFHSTTFGIFPIKNKVITVITYDIKKPQEVYKNVFYGKPIPRAKILAFSKRFKTDKGVNFSWIKDPIDRTKLTLNEKEDELTVVKDISDIDYLYYTSIIDKQTNKIIFESTVWQYGLRISEEHEPLPSISIDKSIFKKSGDYEIIIQPGIKWDISSKEIEKYITRYSLSVTLDEDNYTKKELFIYTLIVVFAIGLTFLVILYFIKKKNKKKLSEKEQQKSTARLQLNSIRSQLNPHFLFNALSGIQNLMNKNEIDNANKYLSKFARLTRNVLDDKELISLSQEKRLLDDYLQMEQLRFGFKYDISHSEQLDLDNIEIPSMLLQPFVENAVKHGISNKTNDGKITITFINHKNDLILIVTDNGKGFDTHKKNLGLGLSLSNSRIELLNSIYKENRFILEIQSTNNGSKISLTLTDWL
ncbi:MAG: sensor histidine kinase [Pedobacter sp.]|nr:MAG: sensor histidine kinase [Pedobacter sp.]